MARSRLNLIVMVLPLLACSKASSTQAESGRLGEVDLASKLPAGVTVAPNLESYDVRRSGCHGVKGDQPVDVRVRWKAFTKDGAKYVSSYSVEVAKPVPGVTLELDKEPSVETAIASGKPAMTVARVSVKCTSRPPGTSAPFVETTTFYIRADGTSSINPTW